MGSRGEVYGDPGDLGAPGASGDAGVPGSSRAPGVPVSPGDPGPQGLQRGLRGEFRGWGSKSMHVP